MDTEGMKLGRCRNCGHVVITSADDNDLLCMLCYLKSGESFHREPEPAADPVKGTIWQGDKVVQL